jgi:hypothetical protein
LPFKQSIKYFIKRQELSNKFSGLKTSQNTVSRFLELTQSLFFDKHFQMNISIDSVNAFASQMEMAWEKTNPDEMHVIPYEYAPTLGPAAILDSEGDYYEPNLKLDNELAPGQLPAIVFDSFESISYGLYDKIKTISTERELFKRGMELSLDTVLYYSINKQYGLHQTYNYDGRPYLGLENIPKNVFDNFIVLNTGNSFHFYDKMIGDFDLPDSLIDQRWEKLPIQRLRVTHNVKPKIVQVL